MPAALSLPAHVRLDETDRDQISAVVAVVQEVLKQELIGAYLHGSAVLGGLRSRSDIDVLAVAARRMTPDERGRLVTHLLAVSGDDPDAAPPRPVELTIVVWPEVRPWRHPPTMDFQYGEWLREELESGELGPGPSRTNPDLAPIVTMTLLGEAVLVGPPPSEVLDPVPGADLVEALVAGVPQLLDEIDPDTTNVVLTLARVWNGVVTQGVQSKDAAAAWVLPRLSSDHQAVLARARDIYLGVEAESWDDLRGALRPFADAVVAHVRAAHQSGL